MEPGDEELRRIQEQQHAWHHLTRSHHLKLVQACDGGFHAEVCHARFQWLRHIGGTFDQVFAKFPVFYVFCEAGKIEREELVELLSFLGLAAASAFFDRKIDFHDDPRRTP